MTSQSVLVSIIEDISYPIGSEIAFPFPFHAVMASDLPVIMGTDVDGPALDSRWSPNPLMVPSPGILLTISFTHSQ